MTPHLGEKMFGLITHHATVLCFDRVTRSVTHRRLAEIDPADIVHVTGPGEAELVILERPGVWRTVDVEAPQASRATSPAPAQVAIEAGLTTLRFPHGLLSASPDGAVRVVDGEANDWERFGLVEAASLAGMLEFARHDRIRVADAHRVAHSDIELADRAHLRIGAHLYPIAGNFPRPAGGVAGPRDLLFRDGWMVDEFRLFRPLVFFVLLGSGAYLDQLALATRSLVEHGGYDRDVLVITDQAHERVRDALPTVLHPRLAFLDVQGGDKVDAVLARLMLEEHPEAASYAPILYSDTDVVFDRDLLPILERARLATRMTAQSETWSELPDSSSGGAELYAADPFPLRFPLGFNAGIWMMPGGADSVQVLSTIRRAIGSYLRANGRDSLPWLDQAMANYVLRKLDAFDPTHADETVRLHQRGYELDAGEPTGFVHFWPVSHRADERAEAMAAYLERMRRAAE